MWADHRGWASLACQPLDWADPSWVAPEVAALRQRLASPGAVARLHADWSAQQGLPALRQADVDASPAAALALAPAALLADWLAGLSAQLASPTHAAAVLAAALPAMPPRHGITGARAEPGAWAQRLARRQLMALAGLWAPALASRWLLRLPRTPASPPPMLTGQDRVRMADWAAASLAALVASAAPLSGPAHAGATTP